MLTAVADPNASLAGVPHMATLDELSARWPANRCRGAVHAAAGPLLLGRHGARRRQACLLEKPPGATIAELSPLSTAAMQRNGRYSPPGIRASLARSSRCGNCWPAARITAVKISWKEDVRVWHPGQAWIWQPGGLGVFDPGINALSILTRILPQPFFVTSADLAFPANRDAPIAATLSLSDAEGLPIEAEFDFRQTGPQSWDIDVDTDSGPVTLSSGGARLIEGDKQLVDAADAEYAGLYRRFVELAATGETDADLAPFQLVADAFLLGRRRTVEPFDDEI